MGWTRAEHLRRLAGDAYDVLVIGGGIVGAGTALDLAARGLQVALVEQADFASGTSSRSTKLFHGGIRYLPQYRFGLVAEGLREQKVLVSIADHLFSPLEFVIPLYRNRGIGDAPRWASRGRRAAWALEAGLTLYDILGGRHRPGESHRRVGVDELQTMAPALIDDGLTGGYVYSDAQTDDARLVMAVLKTAVTRFEAVAANRVRAEEVRPSKRGFEVTIRDGEDFKVEARAVVLATGSFPAPDVVGSTPRAMVLSKGAHLITGLETLGLSERAVVLPETDDGRVLYVVPWLGHALVGTTDTMYEQDPSHPAAGAEDIEYLRRHLGRYFDAPDVEPIATFAGLRALADTGAASTAAASREHVVAELRPGLVQVAGGKLTTYRRIAAEVANRVASRLRVRRPSTTAAIPLVGAGKRGSGHLWRRYGSEARVVDALARDERRLGKTFGDEATLAAEVVYCVREEAVTRISDLTLRRTHLAWFTKDHARADAPAIAAVMARELDWSDQETRRQLALHEEELNAEGL
jgi:glycerol-3-phosphate dehydrogenase